uniref:Uncharacterized protein n=1 Tax=Helianthus annuus TaxID=4232 RepID=A0A251SN07_HELAN
MLLFGSCTWSKSNQGHNGLLGSEPVVGCCRRCLRKLCLQTGSFRWHRRLQGCLQYHRSAGPSKWRCRRL